MIVKEFLPYGKTAEPMSKPNGWVMVATLILIFTLGIIASAFTAWIIINPPVSSIW